MYEKFQNFPSLYYTRPISNNAVFEIFDIGNTSFKSPVLLRKL